jgi:hypothetical protein
VNTPPAERVPSVLPLLLTNMLAAALAMGPALFPLGLVAAFFALIAAIVIGAPILWVALRAGLRGEIATTALGAVGGFATLYLVVLGLDVWVWRFTAADFDIELHNSLLLGAIGGVSAGLYWAFNLAPPGLKFWRAVRLPLTLLVMCWIVDAWTIGRAVRR